MIKKGTQIGRLAISVLFTIIGFTISGTTLILSVNIAWWWAAAKVGMATTGPGMVFKGIIIVILFAGPISLLGLIWSSLRYEYHVYHALPPRRRIQLPGR